MMSITTNHGMHQHLKKKKDNKKEKKKRLLFSKMLKSCFKFILLQELPNVSLVELQNIEPSQNWRDSDAANRVNETRKNCKKNVIVKR